MKVIIKDTLNKSEGTRGYCLFETELDLTKPSMVNIGIVTEVFLKTLYVEIKENNLTYGQLSRTLEHFYLDLDNVKETFKGFYGSTYHYLTEDYNGYCLEFIKE